MQRFRYLLLSAFILFTLTAMAGIVSAGTLPTYNVTITDITCERVSLTYQLSAPYGGGAPAAEIEVTVDGSPAGGTLGPIQSGGGSFILNLTPRAAPYVVQVTAHIAGANNGSATAQIICGGESIAFGQICFGHGAVAATVFMSAERIDIYAIDEQDRGERVMSFTQEYLRTIPAEGVARLLGDSDRHIAIEFYRNANRLYRMVAGPDAHDKYFECTFGGSCSMERTWVGEANRLTDEVEPVCDPVLVPSLQPTSGMTATLTATSTFGLTATFGPTPTPTDTPTFEPPTLTPTDTATFEPPTLTPTDTPTFEPPTNTVTFTPTPTDNPTLTPTPTDPV